MWIAKFAGTVESAETNERITIRPTYEECDVTIGESTLPATVKMTHCDYEFHGGKKEAGSEHAFEGGEVDLVCPNEGEAPHIEIFLNAAEHAAGKSLCSLTPQPFKNKVGNTFLNTTGTTDDIDITSNVGGIAVIRTGSILCGAKNQEATYKGYTTMKAYEDKGVHLIKSEPTIYEYTEGAQLGLTVSE